MINILYFLIYFNPVKPEILLYIKDFENTLSFKSETKNIQSVEHEYNSSLSEFKYKPVIFLLWKDNSPKFSN